MGVISQPAHSRVVFRKVDGLRPQCPVRSVYRASSCVRHRRLAPGETKRLRYDVASRAVTRELLLNVAELSAAGAGLILIARTAANASRRRNEDREAEREKNRELHEELENLRRRLEETEEGWEADRQRVTTLEKARASAVQEITKALAQKRDAEFALATAQKELKVLRNSRSTTANPQKLTSADVTDEVLCSEPANEPWSDEGISQLEEAEGSTVRESALQELKARLQEENKRRKAAEVELQTVKEYAKAELRAMNSDLIRGRDASDDLKKEISLLKGNTSSLHRALEEAETVIENLHERLLVLQSVRPKDASTDRYAHEMRAEAAYMVERIEDKAHDALQRALRKSESAQMTAFKKFVEASKARDREQKLRETLAETQEKIKEQSRQVKYLTELIEILSSKEMQERSEEQTIKQNFPLED